MSNLVCDMNCEKCIFEDCINDTLTASDFKLSRSLDQDAINDETPKRVLNRRKSGLAWYYRNRSSELIRSATYRAEHREELRDKAREYHKEHREEVNQRNLANYYSNHEENKKKSRDAKRERYQANKEYYRQKQREYRQRVRERSKQNEGCTIQQTAPV